MNLSLLRALCITTLTLSGGAATAANMAYISSASGYLLHNNGGTAVTADWGGRGPVQGFSGYGQVHLNGQCLTGANGGQPLRWEGCRGGDKSQIWALSGRKLNNELGWCADVEGNRGGAGVRILAYKCTGAVNQQWRGHEPQSIRSVAASIGNPAVRALFEDSVRVARPGDIISKDTGRVVAAGGGNAVAAGGANVVAAGGGNVVAAGGGN